MAKSQIKVGAVLGYVKMGLSVGVAFIYTPIMLRLLGKSEYGLYSLVASMVGYLSVLDMGFGNAMVQFLAKAKAKNESAKEARLNGIFLLLYVVMGVIALIIGSVLLLNINSIYGDKLTSEELGKARVIMAILVATVAISFPLSVFDSFAIANEQYILIRIVDVIKTVAYPMLALPLLFMGYKSISMVVVTSALTVASHLYMLYYCFAKLRMKIVFKHDKTNAKLIRRIVNYSFFIFLGIIVDVVFNNTDQVILGGVCGTAAVAIYAVAIKISSINMNFSTTISALFLPRITKMLERDDSEKEVSKLFIRVSRIQLYIMAFILSAFLFLGRDFVVLWAGEDYQESFLTTVVLIAPSIIPLTQNVALSVIQAKNKHRFRAIVYMIIAVLNIGISIPLAKRFGSLGAAYGTAIANLLGQILVMNIYYAKVIKLDILGYWKNFIAFMVPIMVCLPLAMAIKNKLVNGVSWMSLIICGLCFGVIYCSYVFLYMNKDERGQIARFYRRRR